MTRILIWLRLRPRTPRSPYPPNPADLAGYWPRGR